MKNTRSFWRIVVWEVVELPALLAKTVEEIRDTLERCLNIEFSKTVPDSFSKKCLANEKIIFGLSRESKTEILAVLKQANALSDQIKTSKKLEHKILALSDLCQLLTEFIWDYWKIFPLELRQRIAAELRKNTQRTNAFSSKINIAKERSSLLLPSLRSGKDLYAIKQKASKLFVTALLEAFEEDRAEVTEKAISDLKKEIFLIQNLEVRQHLENELLNIESFSDLSSLRETVHLFRSPENAERLLAAMKEANSGLVEPLSLDEMQQELGLVKEKQSRK